MRSSKVVNTNIGVGVGIVLQIIGKGLAAADHNLVPFAFIFVLVGAVFFIWGCMNYAEGKGHSKWLGLLGLFSCLGLIVLILLPDNYKRRR